MEGCLPETRIVMPDLMAGTDVLLLDRQAQANLRVEEVLHLNEETEIEYESDMHNPVLKCSHILFCLWQLPPRRIEQHPGKTLLHPEGCTRYCVPCTVAGTYEPFPLLFSHGLEAM